MSDKIRLFNIPRYKIDSIEFENILYGMRVLDFECEFAEFVGYKYAVACNSASSIIFLLCKLLQETYKSFHVTVPTVCPVVVPNMVHLAGCKIEWNSAAGDNWVGGEYPLFTIDGIDARIIDCAHTTINPAGYGAIYSFYPTKPIGGIDGGMLCSNDFYVVDTIRTMATNGRQNPGYKIYMNSMQAEWASKSLKAYPAKKEKLDAVRDAYNAAFGLENDSYHLYRIKPKRILDVPLAIKCFVEEGIETKQHYTAHSFFPESQTTSTISIPYHDVLTQQQIDYIIEKVKPWVWIK